MSTGPRKPVNSKEEFVDRVYAMREDLVEGKAYWQNTTLDQFLGTLAFWTEDRMEEMYTRHGYKMPEEGSDIWQIMYDLLWLAAIYD